jgi:hypothetical protein
MAVKNDSVELCLNADFVTKDCICGKKFQPRSKRHRFCSGVCRIRAFRQPQVDRRNRWTYLKHRDSHFTVGSLSVRRPAWLGPLSTFERNA